MLEKDTYIFGCGGFGREICHLLEDINNVRPTYKILGFLDDDKSKYGTDVIGYPVVGGQDICASLKNETNIIVGLGDTVVRSKLIGALSMLENVVFPNCIHPRASITRTSILGIGVIVLENTIVSCSSIIADHCFISYNSVVGHDVKFESFVQVSPSVTICGHVNVLNEVFIGAGSTINNGNPDDPIVIGRNAIIGAGSSVIFSVDEYVTVMGVPAMPVFRKEYEV